MSKDLSIRDQLEIERVNFYDNDHCNAVKRLMRIYMLDPMGGTVPFNQKQENDLIEGLRDQANLVALLACLGNEYVGLINTFVNFSTFAARRFINIHDLVVDYRYRHNNVGRLLMAAIEKEATELGCSKITLEVREDNFVAQNLYKKMGFAQANPNMYFWVKMM